jgi:hypothetical protein
MKAHDLAKILLALPEHTDLSFEDLKDTEINILGIRIDEITLTPQVVLVLDIIMDSEETNE